MAFPTSVDPQASIPPIGVGLFSRSVAHKYPMTKWESLGNASREMLLHEIEDMYWKGVHSEMMNAIRTLREWYQIEHETENIAKGRAEVVYEAETLRKFVHQVTSTGRKIADMSTRKSL
jgi:hypothetical protein